MIPGTLGVCRLPSSEAVIIFAGDELSSRSRIVSRHLHDRPIYRHGMTEPLSTTMLTLPSMPHFDQFAAFIVAELVRQDAEKDLGRAYRLSEPLIELAFAQHTAALRTLYALAARVALLAEIVDLSDDEALPRVVSAWCSDVPFRDLAAFGVGVVVRGADSSSPSIPINHVAEVSPASGESSLLLLSVALTDSRTSGDFTLPDLVDRIFDRLRSAAPDHIEPLSTWLAGFRRSDAFEYRHDTAAADSFYGRAMSVDNSMAIDLMDPALGALRQQNLEDYPAVVPGSVRYKLYNTGGIVTPSPRVGLETVATAIAHALRDS